MDDLPAHSDELNLPASLAGGSDSTAPQAATCPFCEAEIGEHARKCRYCGEWVARSCEGCGTPLKDEWAARGVCAECRKAESTAVAAPMARGMTRAPRNKLTAVVLAGLLGGLGVHRFYLGRPGSGFLYLIFFWTFIPVMISLFEVVRMAIMDEEEFHLKYSS